MYRSRAVSCTYFASKQFESSLGVQPWFTNLGLLGVALSKVAAETSPCFVGTQQLNLRTLNPATFGRAMQFSHIWCLRRMYQRMKLDLVHLEQHEART